MARYERRTRSGSLAKFTERLARSGDHHDAENLAVLHVQPFD